MLFELARNWWVMVLRGVLAILFGVMVFFWPVLAWVVVVASFAAYALVDGVFTIGMAITGPSHGWRWWALVFQGLLGIAAGLITFLMPGVTQLVLLALIAYWAIATGMFAVVAAIRLREVIQGEWVLALSGILSVLFGFAIVLMPLEGALAVAWLIGSYSIAFGILLLTLGFRLRSLLRHAPKPDYIRVP